eukprot:s3763_g4.t1
MTAKGVLVCRTGPFTLPIEGARFIHSKWNLIDTCRPSDMVRRAMSNASWALSCIQMDLRHHIDRLGGTTYLDGRSNARFHDVVRCDEGGWVHIEDLFRMEVLWSAQSRQITTTASRTDEDQRKRIYNERVQLLINGNLLPWSKTAKRKATSSVPWCQVKGSSCRALQPWRAGTQHDGIEARSDHRIAEQPLHQERATVAWTM